MGNYHQLPLILLIMVTISSSLEGMSSCSPICPTRSHSAAMRMPVSQNLILELSMTNYFRYHTLCCEEQEDICIDDSDHVELVKFSQPYFTANYRPPSLQSFIDIDSSVCPIALPNYQQILYPQSPTTQPQPNLTGPAHTNYQQIPSAQPIFINIQPPAHNPPPLVATPSLDDIVKAVLTILKQNQESQQPAPQPVPIVQPVVVQPLPACTTEIHQEKPLPSLCNVFIDLTPFFFISTQSKQLTEYLLPNHASSLTVAENNTSDVSAPWIQITTSNKSFSSTLYFHPQRRECGLALNLFVRLNALCTEETHWPERLWMSAFIPVEWVQHTLKLDEVITSTSTVTPSPFSSATAAFNNSEWCFGKLSCKPLNKFGVADIELRLGDDFILNQYNHLALYGCVFIPTSKGLNSHYLFEPTIGNLGHPGLGFGLNGDWCIWQKNNHSFVNWITDLRYAYFFGHHEERTTDSIMNDDWSRYLEVASPTALGTPLPGINYLTQSVNVIPRNSATIWTALHFQHYNFHLEVGYNFWYRQKESVEHFKAPGVVIYDILGIPGSQTSASSAIISAAEPGIDEPVSDAEPALITAGILSTDTPAIPSLAVGTLYASMGAQCGHHHPVFITGGLSYDIAYRAPKFSGVNGWLKVSIAL